MSFGGLSDRIEANLSSLVTLYNEKLSGELVGFYDAKKKDRKKDEFSMYACLSLLERTEIDGRIDGSITFYKRPTSFSARILARYDLNHFLCRGQVRSPVKGRIIYIPGSFCSDVIGQRDIGLTLISSSCAERRGLSGK